MSEQANTYPCDDKGDNSREHFERLQLAVKSANIGLWDWHIQSNRVFFSNEWRSLIGYGPDEIANEFSEWERLVHPDDLADALDRVNRYIKEPWPNYENVFRMRHKDGSYRWIMARASLIQDDSGAAVRMIGSHVDITERKLLEQAIEHRARFERVVSEISSDFVRLEPDEIDEAIGRSLKLLGEFTRADRAYVFVYRDGGRIVDNTHEWCADGIEPEIETLQGIDIGKDYPWFAARIRERDSVCVPDVDALPLEAHADQSDWRRQGIKSLLVVPMVRGHELVGFLGFDSVRSTREWSEDDASILRLLGETLVHAFARREAAAALTRSEENYRELVEGLTDFIVRWKPGPELVYVNDRYCEYFGLTRDQVAGTSFLKFIHPDDREQVVVKIAGITPEHPVAEDEHRSITPTGEYAWQWWIDRGFFDSSGNVIEYLSVGRDVTERVRAEEALRASEERYRDVVEMQTEFIVRWKPDGTLTFVNDAYCRYFGKQASELLGTNFFPRIPDEDRERLGKMFDALSPGNNQVYAEHRVIMPDGRVVWHAWSNRASFNSGGEIVEYQGVGRDITERRVAEAARERAETELRQAQKMEVVGRLAGGVAHDFNNMLSVILGYSEQMLSQVPKSHRHHEALSEIRDAARRSAELTGQLMAFSRKQVVAPVPMNLNEVIRSQQRMLGRMVGENVSWNIETPEGLWNIRMDPVQVSQVLANLCVNARDAIADRGAISIETENVRISKSESEHLGYVEPGEYVCLRVSDTGCGMDEETLSHVFEPFFTTKAPDKGTGLGLATVYGAVKQNGGSVHVKSTLGAGSTFEIFFPRCDTQAVPVSTLRTPVPGGTDATILVVEDEPMLLALTQRALEEDGYRVLAAGTPTEACRLARQHANEIDLLLTDIVMPEMNGKELKQVIARINPAIRTVFMSGYTADIVEDQGVTSDGTVLLQKPFSIAALRTTVQNALLV